MQNKSFERFYYEKLAFGEGCGCAEQIIRTRDLDAQSQDAGRYATRRAERVTVRGWLGRLLRLRIHRPKQSKPRPA